MEDVTMEATYWLGSVFQLTRRTFTYISLLYYEYSLQLIRLYTPLSFSHLSFPADFLLSTSGQPGSRQLGVDPEVPE